MGSRFSGSHLGLAGRFQPGDSHLPGHWLEPVPGLPPGEASSEAESSCPALSVLSGKFSVRGQARRSSFLPAPRALACKERGSASAQGLSAARGPAARGQPPHRLSIEKMRRLEYSYSFLNPNYLFSSLFCLFLVILQ